MPGTDHGESIVLTLGQEHDLAAFAVSQRILRRLGRAGVSQSYIIEIVELSVMGKLVLAPQSTKDSDAFGEVACAAFIKQIGIEIGSSSNSRQRSVLAFMNRAAAAAGTGAYKDVVEACNATIRVVDSTPVHQPTRRHYNRVYPQYGRLYQSLKDDYARIAGLVD